MEEKISSNHKVGSVLVVGGGISGMQASLDLAEAGFKVYLVEESPSIGGRMAQLDKTFPTNDCSMCTISPRLIECAKHPNIQIIPDSTLETVEGGAGHFKAILKKSPRYVLLEKCNACGDCLEVCPVEVESTFEQGLGKRKAISRPFPQAIPSAFAINKEGKAPCRLACPAGVNAQGYIALMSQGRFLEAYQLLRKALPLPSVCGRVCFHPCEEACNRKDLDQPLAIRDLKRWLCDWALENPEALKPQEKAQPTGHKVAIVGSGPAGLSAAHDLALLGHSVSVFEALPKPGGMLSYGIPAFRLPRDILSKEIKVIEAMGVQILTSSPIGKDGGPSLPELRNQGYKAVLLASGAHRGRNLKVPGEDLNGYWDAVTFLRKVYEGERPSLGGKVAIVGGGSTAIDAARVALRLGNEEVEVIYRRSPEEMPASPEEVDEACEEGIKFRFLTSPVALMGQDGRLTHLKLIQNALSEPDESGRRRPVPIPNSEFSLGKTACIGAIGQEPDLLYLEKDMEVRKDGTVKVEEESLFTGKEGIFAAGDCVTGPATIVEAIGAGKRAALCIHHYLLGLPLPSQPKEEEKASMPSLKGKKKLPRMKRPLLFGKERHTSLVAEVALPISEEAMREEAMRCLNCGPCCECFLCVSACKAEAIDHEMKLENVELEVGAIILSPGYDPVDATTKPEYGFGQLKNVVTSLQLERLLSAAGPTLGKVKRPSDGKEPLRVAFIQCVGSRDEQCQNPYCSSVCCMYATKEALMIKDHHPESEVTIFYNDIRAFGKGFERYYEGAKESGVRYIKSIVSTVKELQRSKNLIIRYALMDGQIKQEEFDMVVLSVGLKPRPEARALYERLGLKSEEQGYCLTGKFTPQRTSRSGIFVSGAAEGPMDIPEAVMSGSSAACLASGLLKDARGTLIEEKHYPPEREVKEEPARIGVFVCRCGTNIAKVVDVPQLVQFAQSLPGVVHADEYLFSCSTDSQKKIIDIIHEKGINRVVVSSCTPRTHEPLFQETLREAGLNAYLFEMANIRDQCSWVHSTLPEEATEKARELLRMAVSRAATLEPIEERFFDVYPEALVIGGGLSGITAALSLAEQGFPVHLIEQSSQLGGNLLHLKTTLEEGACIEEQLEALLSRLRAEPKIKVYTNAQLSEINGHVGDFESVINQEGENISLRHGAVIVATGAGEMKPTEYLYGEDKRVLTQLELEKRLRENPEFISGLKTVAMILCVGSRDEIHPYCSRICCSTAIKNALELKKLRKDLQIYIFYRDIRTYGFLEPYYREAREAGIVFIRFEVDEKPQLSQEGSTLTLRAFDESLQGFIKLFPELVVLSSGLEAHPLSASLSERLKVPLDRDGFFLEAHLKLRPLDFASEGIYLCGLAHSPKLIQESIAQAQGAAQRAATILSKERLKALSIVAVVDEKVCAACLTCLRACPYKVPIIGSNGKAEIDPALCHGCANCASLCPQKAIDVLHYKDKQVLALCTTIGET